jgi:hypothetical protein
MGAVCYKPKPATITREDILKALNDKMLKETIYFGDEISIGGQALGGMTSGIT